MHAKAKHRRDDFLHQIAVRLVRKYDLIAIEDLDMAAMKKSLKLGKSVSDVGWGEIYTDP
ncbi:MAG: transposase [Coprococcus sp.]